VRDLKNIFIDTFNTFNLSLKKIKLDKKVAALMVATFVSTSANAQGIKALTSDESSKKAEASIPEPRFESHLNMHTIGIGIGQTFLLGDFRKHGEDKITWDVLYSYSASHSFDFAAGFHTSSHKHQGKKTETTGLTLGIKAKGFQYDNFSPFLIGGVGFYRPRVTRDVAGEMVRSDSKTTFGLNVGAGCDLRLNRHFSVGLLFQYHDPFDIKQDKGPSVEGSYGKFLFTTSYTF
jgi:hypothetical protein